MGVTLLNRNAMPNDIIHMKREDFDQVLEKLYASHSAINKVQSDAFGEIKSDISLIKYKLEAIQEDNTRRNGAFVKAVEKFTTEIDDLKGYKNMTQGGVAVIVLILGAVGWLFYEVINLMVHSNVI